MEQSHFLGACTSTSIFKHRVRNLQNPAEWQFKTLILSTWLSRLATKQYHSWLLLRNVNCTYFWKHPGLTDKTLSQIDSAWLLTTLDVKTLLTPKLPGKSFWSLISGFIYLWLWRYLCKLPTLHDNCNAVPVVKIFQPFTSMCML